MKRLLSLVIFLILLFFADSEALPIPQKKKDLTSPSKDFLAIEKKIFELLNKEREKQGLTILRLSEPLSFLARKHSQDMAAHEMLSHRSSSGKEYTDRLVEDGFYFQRNGENVARSDSFLAEVIHEAFMKSQPHRENILTPEFDVVGIGMALSEKKVYYVTQDFLLSLVPKNEEEAKKEIQKKINELRKESSLPPFVFLADPGAYARQYSISKAGMKPVPPLPSRFGGALILYNSSPSLENIYPHYKERAMDEIYESAGLGICFLRNEKNRGGSYFVTLLLFPENKYKKWSKEKLRETVFSRINTVRTQGGFLLFKLDDKLTTQAEKIASEIYTKRENLAAKLEPGMGVLYYVTQDPNILPKGTSEKIENELRNFHSVGIGIFFEKNQEYPYGAFWVAILLKE